MSESLLITLVKNIFPDTKISLFYILLGLLTVWLYKQFRNYLVESNKNILIKTEKAIEIYSELEVVIRKSLGAHGDITLLDQSIIKASSYLPLELLNDFYKMVEYDDDEEIRCIKLRVLHENVKEEIKKLKRTQFDSVTYRHNYGVAEFVEVYYKTRLVSILNPLFHTAFNLLILLITILIVGTIMVTEEWTEKVFLISIMFSVILFLLVLDIVIIEVLLKKRFINTFGNWVAFCLFFIIPFLLVILDKWYSGLLVICCIFIFALYISRNGIRNIGKNRNGSLSQAVDTLLP